MRRWNKIIYTILLLWMQNDACFNSAPLLLLSNQYSLFLMLPHLRQELGWLRVYLLRRIHVIFRIFIGKYKEILEGVMQMHQPLVHASKREQLMRGARTAPGITIDFVC